MPGDANKDSTFVIRRIYPVHSLPLNCPEASCEDTKIMISKDELHFVYLLCEKKEEEILCFCNSATIHG